MKVVLLVLLAAVAVVGGWQAWLWVSYEPAVPRYPYADNVTVNEGCPAELVTADDPGSVLGYYIAEMRKNGWEYLPKESMNDLGKLYHATPAFPGDLITLAVGKFGHGLFVKFVSVSVDDQAQTHVVVSNSDITPLRCLRALRKEP